MDKLGKLFGTVARVKIMRLFLLNNEDVFDMDDISTRSKVPKAGARKEINLLVSIGFLKKKNFIKKPEEGSRKKAKKVQGYIIDTSFQFLKSLEKILVEQSGIDKKELASRFRSAGKIAFLAVSGIFINEDQSRVDILIAGDKIKKDILSRLIASLESEIGCELSYALFDTKEFFYRLSMYDKLVFDVLEYPHERIIDHPQLSTIKVKMVK